MRPTIAHGETSICGWFSRSNYHAQRTFNAVNFLADPRHRKFEVVRMLKQGTVPLDIVQQFLIKAGKLTLLPVFLLICDADSLNL
jgi:hypothetical protein